MSPGLLAARGRQILQKFRDRGIATPASSRLERAARSLEELNSGATALPLCAQLESRLLVQSEAWRTLWDALVVMHASLQRRASSASLLRDHLEAFLSGAELARDDQNHLFRNRQFEATVASRFILGGASLTAAEPDFRLVYHGEEVGIAVKRLTSARSTALRARLADGARQISKAGLRGFIAVNLDSWSIDLGGEPDAASVGARFESQLQDIHSEIELVGEREAVLGCLVFVNWSAWDMSGQLPRFEWRESTRLLRFSDDSTERERFVTFFTGLGERVDNSMAEIHALVRRQLPT